ncbi:MAG: DUF2061 domain-containing protein [Planctomycetota bacterium]|nr:DUF2061 domain-containing protein [Planctomycetota bacterium]
MSDQGVDSTEQRDKESRLRSILKAFTWRIIATATTMTVTYFVTGDLTAASVVGVFDFFLKMLLYYLHERGWQMVPRGSIRQVISPFSRGK